MLWDKTDMQKVMMMASILHDMIVEHHRDVYATGMFVEGEYVVT